MTARRQYLVSATCSDLDWVTLLMEKMPLGVEINDFALPLRNDGSRERAFEYWHLWRESVPTDVVVMVHAPFIDLVPGSLEAEIVELTARRHDEVLGIATSLGARAIIFHSGFNPLVRGPEYRPQWLASTTAYFARLMSQHRGFTFLLENMWEPDPSPLVDLIDAINSPQLRACLDVGHVQIYGQQPPDAWVHALGVRLGHLHLNDNPGDWDQELALGTGKVPIAAVFSAIDSLGYYGTVTFETRGRDAILRSIEHLNRLGLR